MNYIVMKQVGDEMVRVATKRRRSTAVDLAQELHDSDDFPYVEIQDKDGDVLWDSSDINDLLEGWVLEI